MRVNLFRFWPSCILLCILSSVFYLEEGNKYLFVFSFLAFIWVFIGILSYSLNGLDYLKETIIMNLVGWLFIAIIIGLIYIPYYITLPVIGVILFIYFKWIK
jgi:hypothetical protein